MKKIIELDDNDPCVAITLCRTSWGQIIDGLTCRAEQYELTAQYHETGFADGDILEASSAYEANAIAAHYREIIGKIREQVKNG
jgi:hypothetical protein